jgi:hypothetical protein
MKPVELMLSREGIRESDGGCELTKVHCKHIWKCHNYTPKLWKQEWNHSLGVQWSLPLRWLLSLLRRLGHEASWFDAGSWASCVRQAMWSSGVGIWILFLALPRASFMTGREISRGVAGFGICGLISRSQAWMSQWFDHKKSEQVQWQDWANGLFLPMCCLRG